MYCPSCGGEVREDLERCPRCQQVMPSAPSVMPTLPPVDPLLGLLLDSRYRVEKFISRGGMGSVYRGTDLMLGRAVAIKFLDGRYRSDQEVVSRFRREALAAAGLDHPNIIPIYGVGEHAGHHYFVMKFVTGRTVTQIVRENGRLSLSEAFRVAVQVCDGLDHIHGHNYVHRDVKPTNIMVDGRGHAYILDFGILRLTTSNLTQTGLVAGTPEYMSPEQARDAKNTDARSDIYSLGVMIFEMLSGRGPFKADSAFDLLMKHVNEPPPRVSDLVPEIPARVDAVVLKALEKDPRRRYSSAMELRAALAEVLSAMGEPVTRPSIYVGPVTALAGAAERAPFEKSAPPVRAPSAEWDADDVPRSDLHATGIHGEASAVVFPSRRRKVAMVAALLLLAGAGAVAIFALRGPTKKPATAATVAPIPAPVPAPSSPAPTPAPASTPRAAPKPVADRQPRRLRELSAVALAPAPAPAPGTLDVGSTPGGAKVLLDDRDLGKTPVAGFRVRAGVHKLVLKKRGYAAYRAELKIEPGVRATIEAKLKPLPGRLSVVIRYGGQLSYAEVVLDGRSLGTAPVAERRVGAGKHRVIVRRAGYITEEKSVRVPPGAHQKVVFNLQRQ